MSRAHAIPVCSLVPVAELFEKSLLRTRTSPRFLSSCGLYRRRARGTRFFCAAGFPAHRTKVPSKTKINTIQGSFIALRAVPHVLLPPFCPSSFFFADRRSFSFFVSFPTHAQFALRRASFSLPCLAPVPPTDRTNAHRSLAFDL